VRLAPALCLLTVPFSARAQEPIFVTPPVTMYQFGGVVGVDVERQGHVTAVSSEVALGVLPPWTLSLHAVGIDAPSGSPEFARAHLGTRVRLLKRDRPREWLILSAYGARALTAGEAADAVARAHGVPEAVLGLSATRMARGGDAFVDLSLASVPTPAGNRLAGAFGLARGWRPRPGDYGDVEAQLFGEALLRYAEGGVLTLGLAPGLLVHSKNKVFKVGVLLPVWERDADIDPTVKAAAKVLF
jgi:hypothetical protein